jgi:CRISPR-associated endonuclease Csn1
VQKLSSKFYEFRLNTEASIQGKEIPYYRRITGFAEGIGGWITHNPIKVKISAAGKIEKIT